MNRDENQKRLARLAPQAVILIDAPGVLTLAKLIRARDILMQADEAYDDGYPKDDPP